MKISRGSPLYWQWFSVEMFVDLWFHALSVQLRRASNASGHFYRTEKKKKTNQALTLEKCHNLCGIFFPTINYSSINIFNTNSYSVECQLTVILFIWQGRHGFINIPSLTPVSGCTRRCLIRTHAIPWR